MLNSPNINHIKKSLKQFKMLFKNKQTVSRKKIVVY